jgi:NhaP-type Na+/H+ and K+/H+ antiporter
MTNGGQTLFNAVFVVVIVSVAAQGCMLPVAARMLRLSADEPASA